MQQQQKNKYLSWFFGIISVILLVTLDQYTKCLAVLHLKNKMSISIISDVFELHYLENHGAAFGIFQGQQLLFIIITVLLLLMLVYFYTCIPVNKHFVYMRLLFILFIAGAIGNFIDRCTCGYVIDFFYFKLIDFPIFNVADIYVTVAAALFIIFFCFYYTEEDINKLFAKLPFRKKKDKE